jgi:ornithine cyclodeaminase
MSVRIGESPTDRDKELIVAQGRHDYQQAKVAVMTTLLHDADIRARLSAIDAVRWMGDAIDAHHRGDLLAPPRVHAEFDDARLVFTAGRLRGSWFGYRSYDTLPVEPGAQVVVVHDETSGQVRAIAVGNELGARRVGAIGAVAADALAPADASVVAIIGSGTQAHNQLWALSAVRNIHEVRVYSRDETHRAAFVNRASPLVDGTIRSASNPKEACEGAEIVILATTSPTPVIEVSWLGQGTYVTTLGPKQQGRAEFGLDLPEAASVLVTDSLDQIGAYDPPNLLANTPHELRLVSLGALRAGEAPKAMPDSISVFFSVGLAGTEAFLLDKLSASIDVERQ